MTCPDHFRTRHHAAAAVLAVLATAALATGAGAQSDPACDYLIVTADALAPAFAPLAGHRAAQGYAVDLVTMDEVLAGTEPQEDDAATLRAYLARRHAESGVQFVLLGGDETVLPVRMCRHQYPSYAVDFPADQYFACHDGTWNADGDTLYGELLDDAVDLAPEVALGRAPVATFAEADAFVLKTLARLLASQALAASALLAGSVLSPEFWEPGDPVMLDGATELELAAGILGSVTPPFGLVRLYENHAAYDGALPLTAASLRDSLGTGDHGLVDLYTRVGGGAIEAGAGYLYPDDLADLGNAANPAVVVALLGENTNFTSSPCILEAGLRGSGGGFSAVLGTAAAAYYLPLAQLHQHLLGILPATGDPRLGLMVRGGLHAFLQAAPDATAWKLTAQVVTLLGDPALMLWADGTVVVDDPGPGDTPPAARRLQVEPCYPNPFNPLTTLAYTLAQPGPVDVTVFDLRGRRVRALVRAGAAAAGRHTVQWDGASDAGLAMPSGVYVFRVSTGADVQSVRAVLAR